MVLKWWLLKTSYVRSTVYWQVATKMGISSPFKVSQVQTQISEKSATVWYVFQTKTPAAYILGAIVCPISIHAAANIFDTGLLRLHVIWHIRNYWIAGMSCAACPPPIMQQGSVQLHVGTFRQGTTFVHQGANLDLEFMTCCLLIVSRSATYIPQDVVRVPSTAGRPISSSAFRTLTGVSLAPDAFANPWTLIAQYLLSFSNGNNCQSHWSNLGCL